MGYHDPNESSTNQFTTQFDAIPVTCFQTADLQTMLCQIPTCNMFQSKKVMLRRDSTLCLSCPISISLPFCIRDIPAIFQFLRTMVAAPPPFLFHNKEYASQVMIEANTSPRKWINNVKNQKHDQSFVGIYYIYIYTYVFNLKRPAFVTKLHEPFMFDHS